MRGSDAQKHLFMASFTKSFHYKLKYCSPNTEYLTMWTRRSQFRWLPEKQGCTRVLLFHPYGNCVTFVQRDDHFPYENHFFLYIDELNFLHPISTRRSFSIEVGRTVNCYHSLYLKQSLYLTNTTSCLKCLLLYSTIKLLNQIYIHHFFIRLVKLCEPGSWQFTFGKCCEVSRNAILPNTWASHKTFHK